VSFRSRDSSVGIATGYGLEDGVVRVRVPVRQEFLFFHAVNTGSGVHPISYTLGTGGSFLGGKAAGAWSWPLPTDVEAKKMWIYTSTPIRFYDAQGQLYLYQVSFMLLVSSPCKVLCLVIDCCSLPNLFDLSKKLWEGEEYSHGLFATTSEAWPFFERKQEWRLQSALMSMFSFSAVWRKDWLCWECL
jgi:hypothetical protein